jgi:DnaJ-class molecular chaperone
MVDISFNNTIAKMIACAGDNRDKLVAQFIKDGWEPKPCTLCGGDGTWQPFKRRLPAYKKPCKKCHGHKQIWELKSPKKDT